MNESKAKLSTVATFPEGTFLENLVVRADNSLLVSSLKARQIFYVPPAKRNEIVTPELLYEFKGQNPMSFVEVEPDVFYLCTSDGYVTHASSLHRIDLRSWSPGEKIAPVKVLDFPAAARALNGSCLVGPRTILVADCFASLIWRVDLSDDGLAAHATPWLQHYSMLYHPGEMKPEQPGVNGIRFAEKTSYVYYTASVLKLFMRVRVARETLAPLGEPEYIAGGKMMDDFCLDEHAGVAYVTTHRDNTIDRIRLDPAKAGETVSIVGAPFDGELVGPSSGAWSRHPGDYGRVAFFTTDGGTTAPPPDGQLRAAKVLRVEVP